MTTPINPNDSDADLIVYLTLQNKELRKLITEIIGGVRTVKHYGELADAIEKDLKRIENQKYYNTNVEKT